MYIDKIEDIPAEALAVLKKKFSNSDIDFESMEEICELIREASYDYKESTDSCYITCTYFLKIEDWKFEIDGNSYRKDQSVCDEELDDGFTLTSIEQEKKNKLSKQKADRAKSDESWRALLSSIKDNATPEEIFNTLKEYKFPKIW